MINSILKSDKKEQNTLFLENLLNESYLLPNWEKIKDVIIEKRKMFCFKKYINAGLYRKFSSKNSVEKYCIKNQNNDIIAGIDLRVYKDCVYIINCYADLSFNFENSFNILLQVAVEKAFYNTTDKKLNINLSFPPLLKSKIKKIISVEDFEKEEVQSKYEQEMFGEIFSLNAASSSFWQKKIKQQHLYLI